MTRAADNQSRRPRDIVIAGGGISGLATAFFLKEALSPEAARIQVLEGSARWGGLIFSQKRADFLLEAGPDALVTQKPQGLDLCRRLGLQPELMESPPAHRRSYVFSSGQLRPLPEGVISEPPLAWSLFLHNPLLSWPGRLRAALEPLVPATRLQDEAVADFVRRRMGTEVLENIFEPLVQGVYGGEAGRLSMRSTFPRLFQAERTRGKLMGRSGSTSPPAHHRFVSLKGGLARLVRRLLEELEGRVELCGQVQVRSLRRAQGRFQVQDASGKDRRADAVVLATPATVSAGILAAHWPQIARPLGQIPYLAALLLLLAYDREVTAGWPGSGFLVPPVAGMTLAACTFAHQKFAGRCPPGHSLLRCFVGGAASRRLLEAPDDRVVERVRADLRRMAGIEQRPILSAVYRWPQALPQYGLGHADRVVELEKMLEGTPGLYLAGNYLDGVGISDCVRHAQRVARSLSAGHFN